MGKTSQLAAPESSDLALGVDTGGTFTDFIHRAHGHWQVRKVLSTPDNPARAVMDGLARTGLDFKEIILGSTVATNTILEKKGARTAFVTNRGFADLIEIGRQNRRDLYALSSPAPFSLVPRQFRHELNCRLDARGEIRHAIDAAELAALATRLAEQNIESVAVCFLFAFLNPDPEIQVRRALAQTDRPVSLSHEILPEFREFERAAATVLNAYVAPRMAGYIGALKQQLPDTPLRIMQSNGGVITPAVATAEPVRTVLSGPAGGVVAALEIGRRAGYDRLITLDMGGTSTDVALLDSQIPVTTTSQLAGYPLGIPMIDIHSVGAGGGSLAALDQGGALTVGPESAGASPGPVCYGQGKRITVTDANLFLGRLSAAHFLGGEMVLDTARTATAMEKLAHTAGLSATELAEGILSVTNAAMERAIRVISVEKGIDPADFTLLAFGGAGGLQAAFLARLLHLPRVLIPPHPGTLSAQGMLLADIVKDVSRTVMWSQATTGRSELAGGLSELRRQAAREMTREGVQPETAIFQAAADMRYTGQSYELQVPWEEAEDNPTADIFERFHTVHRQRYGQADPDKNVEIVNLRVRAVSLRKKPAASPLAAADTKKIPATAVAHRQAMNFDGRMYSAPVLLRQHLRPGHRFSGPALICEYSATLVVPPFACGHLDTWGNLIVKIAT